jgi:hypothetical protein
MRLPNGLPADLPEEFAEANARFTFRPAEPQEPARFETPIRVSGTPPETLERVWESARQRHQEMMARIRDDSPAQVRELPPEMEAAVEMASTAQRIIGISGLAGSGKSSVASMIPGAFVLQMADPLYAMLSAMLGIPEPLLRQREFKESQLPWLGKTPRELLQTLGTEWGRQNVCPDVWIKLLRRRIESLAEQGIAVIAVCDVRFDNEAEFLRGLGGEVWHVRRPGCQGAGDHSSESGVAVGPADPVIDNAGTLEDLRASVDAAFTRHTPAAAS